MNMAPDATIDTAPLNIVLLALPETTPGALYGLHEIFHSVGKLWQDMTGEEVRVRSLSVRILSSDGKPCTAPLGGAPIVPEGGVADASGVDIVIVTDLALAADQSLQGRWPIETAWLRDQFDQGATLCSVCTGSVLLAEAGLLDGLQATSHWSATRLFAEHYPRVRLAPERILCPAGSEHRIITSGGSGSFADLALYLIARFCGRAEAIRIAKIFLIGDRSEGQLPFAAIGKAAQHQDAVIRHCQAWLAEYYTEAKPVARMAALSGLPERTFKRRFRAATGYSPIDYVQTLRIEEAKQILETTDEPTDAVAHLVGYDDPAFFRRLFKRLVGVTPARYRQRFQALHCLAEMT